MVNDRASIVPTTRIETELILDAAPPFEHHIWRLFALEGLLIFPGMAMAVYSLRCRALAWLVTPTGCAMRILAFA